MQLATAAAKERSGGKHVNSPPLVHRDRRELRGLSAKIPSWPKQQSDSLLRGEKCAVMGPSGGDHDQETDPRTNRTGGKIESACGPAWNPQLNELQ